MKDNYNLYVFPKEIITKLLVNILKEYHECSFPVEFKKINKLEIVPASKHFLAFNRCNEWSYKEKIVVTKKQVDKFIQINNVIPMDFIEFVETYKD